MKGCVTVLFAFVAWRTAGCDGNALIGGHDAGVGGYGGAGGDQRGMGGTLADGGPPPDASGNDGGACACTQAPDGEPDVPIATSLDCYCGVSHCLRNLDDELATDSQYTSTCWGVRQYAGCGLTVVATDIGLDPVNLAIYDSTTRQLVGLLLGSDVSTTCPFDNSTRGLLLEVGRQVGDCVMTDCSVISTSCWLGSPVGDNAGICRGFDGGVSSDAGGGD
jgi:hypothetical protein